MKEEKENYLQEFEEYKEIIKNPSGLSENDLIEIYNKGKVCYRKIQEIRKLEEDKVIYIIEKIKEEYDKNNQGYAMSEFRRGGCYYFSIMLKKIFREDAKIYICENSGIHSITKVYDSFYDIGGKIGQNTGIDINDYHEPTEEEFSSFIDKCYLFRNKESIEIFEKKCDDIVEKIINENFNNELVNNVSKM